MIAAIRAFFDQNLGSPTQDPEVQEHKIALATAALLYEVVLADQEIGQAERTQVLTLLRGSFDLDDTELHEIADLAQQEVREATDLFQFTRLINEHFDQPQREAMVCNMWRVAMADGQVHPYEEHLIRRVADLLHLHHHHFIRAKLQAREQSPAAEAH